MLKLLISKIKVSPSKNSTQDVFQGLNYLLNTPLCPMVYHIFSVVPFCLREDVQRGVQYPELLVEMVSPWAEILKEGIVLCRRVTRRMVSSLPSNLP